MPYAAIAAVHADPIEPMPTYESTALTTELSHEAVDTLLSVAGPGSQSPQTVIELRLLGGALAREPKHRSAFCHRDASFALMVAGVLVPPSADTVVGHSQRIDRVMAPWTTGRALPNFAPSDDPEQIARTYDEDTAHWLSALGNEHDPDGVLRVGQVMRLIR